MHGIRAGGWLGGRSTPCEVLACFSFWSSLFFFPPPILLAVRLVPKLPNYLVRILAGIALGEIMGLPTFAGRFDGMPTGD